MSLSAKLLRWYDRHGRDLPWRKSRDPYRILVSEIMLQQTQVSRGLVFYHRWLSAFPTWKSLAAASNAEVLKAWSGLGYNRRALMLRDIARQVVEHGVPKTRERWLALKGIGEYTASALAAFSLGERVLPIDTNIRRVLGRALFGLPFPTPKIDTRISQAGDRVLPSRGRFSDVPQALFDLATMVCKKKPECAVCPLRSECLAANTFLAGNIRTPKRSIPTARERRHRNKPHPDRIYRGRILKLLHTHPRGVAFSALGPAIDPSYASALDRAWLLSMLKRMQKDGMLSLAAFPRIRLQ